MTLPAFVVIAVAVAAVVAVVVVAEVVVVAVVVVEGRERLVEPYFLLLDLDQFFPSQN